MRHEVAAMPDHRQPAREPTPEARSLGSRAGLDAAGASELLGGISALACALPAEQAALLLDDLLATAHGAPEPELRARASEALAAADQSLRAEARYRPPLPVDDAPLAEQAQALVDFCRGFLSGLGLAGPGLRHRLPAVTAEALQLLDAIAAGPVLVEDEFGDRDAFAELLAFVGDAVALTYAELRAAPGDHAR